MKISEDDIKGYLHKLALRGRCSPATVRNYRSTLGRFAKKHRSLTAESVGSFLESYTNPASANVALVRLRGLAEYLNVSLAKVPRAKEPVKEPEALTSSEVNALVDAADHMSPQLGHIVRLLSLTGLRFSEFFGDPRLPANDPRRTGLTDKSVTFRDGCAVLVVVGKGNKTRTVSLSDAALESFQSIQFPIDIPEKKFRTLLRKAGQSANLEVEVHPHLLRATCASVLINEKRVDSLIVARLLGWSKVDTLSSHYYKPSFSTLKGALQ